MTTTQDTSLKDMNVTGITGGSAQNVISAGIIHGNVTVGSEEHLQNLEGQTLDAIGIWTEGMIRVSAVDIVIQKLQGDNNWVTLTGNAGEGKTSLGYMVLKSLSKEGRKVFKIDTPEDYTHIVRKWKNSVIMLNDIFGAFAFDSSALNKWQSLIQDVLNEHEKSKDKTNETQILLISRRNVLEGARDHFGEYSEAVLDKCRVDLSQMRKTHERLEILNYFLSEHNIVVDDSVTLRIASGNTPHGFPHCCNIYTRLAKKGEPIDIEKFFTTPLQFLDQTTKVLMQNSNHVALVKAMIINDGQLDISSITEDQQRYDIQTSAAELMGSFLKKSSGLILFSHPSIYESVISVMDGKDQTFVICNASISVLMQKLNIKQNDQDIVAGCINVDPLPNVIGILTDRFRPQILKKDFSVFENLRLSRNVAFCQALVKSSTRRSWLSLDIFKTKQTVYIDYEDCTGQTMLLTAEESGNYPAACVLLQHGANVNRAKGPWYLGGKSPLHVACDRKSVNSEHISHLIKHGADVNKSASMKMPFHRQTLSMHFPQLDGRTPLHDLCDRGQPDIDVSAVQLLINHGAHVNKANNYGETALHFLCKQNQPCLNAIGLLIRNGADLDKVNENRMTAIHYIFRRLQPNCRTVELLLKEGADRAKAQDYRGTALNFQCARDKPDLIAIRSLIREGVDVNKTELDKRTALHHLCGHDQPDISAIKLLIKHGADVNAADDYGLIPLRCLCRRAHPNVEAVKLLIEKGSDVNKTDINGSTSLHSLSLCDEADVSVIEFLIEHEADVNKANDRGATALHCMCMRKQTDFRGIELLVKRGANINQGNDDGRTALHYLFRQDNPDLSAVEFLIKHGADVNKSDVYGHTPLHCVQEKHNASYQHVLLMVTKETDLE